MTALTDMNRESLVRELRIATARGNPEQAKRIKRELVRRRQPLNSVKVETPRHWQDRD